MPKAQGPYPILFFSGHCPTFITRIVSQTPYQASSLIGFNWYVLLITRIGSTAPAISFFNFYAQMSYFRRLIFMIGFVVQRMDYFSLMKMVPSNDVLFQETHFHDWGCCPNHGIFLVSISRCLISGDLFSWWGLLSKRWSIFLWWKWSHKRKNIVHLSFPFMFEF